MRPKIEIKFSLRLPPTLSTELAVKNLQEILTTDVPYSAKVTIIVFRSKSRTLELAQDGALLLTIKISNKQ